MKLIPLTQGFFAEVDDDDFEKVSGFKWKLKKFKNNKFYVIRTICKRNKRSCQYLHQFILGASGIDHKDGNGLNNQKVNLRKATQQQNSFNRSKSKNNTSGYKGVRIIGSKKFEARINVKGKCLSLGHFENIKNCAKAYDEAAKIYHGEFARLNFEEK